MKKKTARPTPSAKTISAQKHGSNVLAVHMDVQGENWEQWFLLSSDRHHDSPHSDRELARAHLEACRARNAYVIDIGDTFDAMQGKFDPRRSYPDMRPEYLEAMIKRQIGYLDAIVDDAVAFYAPYADRFLVFGKGNHETAIARHNDVDLTNRLVYGLNSRANTNIAVGMYGGWVKFLFRINTTQRTSINLKYFHGSGGGGPVTKGVIQSNRQAVFLPDAHIVVNGHIHESWILYLKRERLSDGCVVYQDSQVHVRTATYKDEYGVGDGGWATEKGMPPKPKGAVWLRFYRDRNEVRFSLIQDVR